MTSMSPLRLGIADSFNRHVSNLTIRDNRTRHRSEIRAIASGWGGLTGWTEAWLQEQVAQPVLGKLLHGRRDAFATGCDPGPNRDPRVDRTQPHTLTGHPDDGSRQRRGPLRGHHPLQSAQRGLAAHRPHTAKQKPLARHRWLVRKRRVYVVVGRWQRTAATPASTQPTRVRVPASKGSVKKARVLPVPTPPHRFGMEVAAPRTPGTTAGLLNNLLGRRRRSAVAHRAQVPGWLFQAAMLQCRRHRRAPATRPQAGT